MSEVEVGSREYYGGILDWGMSEFRDSGKLRRGSGELRCYATLAQFGVLGLSVDESGNVVVRRKRLKYFEPMKKEESDIVRVMWVGSRGKVKQSFFFVVCPEDYGISQVELYLALREGDPSCNPREAQVAVGCVLGV